MTASYLLTDTPRQGIKIYIKQGGGCEVRRIPMPDTLEQFDKLLKNWNHERKYELTYVDEDKDTIVCSTELEWNELKRNHPIVVTATFQTEDISVPSTGSISWKQLREDVPEVGDCIDYLRYFTSTPLADYVDRTVLQQLMTIFGTPSIGDLCADLIWLCGIGVVALGITADTAASFLSDKPQGSFIFRPSGRYPGQVAISRKSDHNKASHFFAVTEKVQLIKNKLRKQANLSSSFY